MTMHRLYPSPADVDPFEAYPRPATPAVRVNMIVSVDGSTGIGGRSGPLSGPADRELFHTLRSLADVILVGAGTMRAERYGPARPDGAARARRAALGLRAVPPIAVLTRSCRLDWEAPFFTAAQARPIVITTGAAPARDRQRAAAVADLVVVGSGDEVQPVRALAALREQGAAHVLVEGGPHLNAQLAAAGLIDELCLTISPVLVAGDAGRVLAGRVLNPPARLVLAHVLEADGYMFLRYQRHSERSRVASNAD